MRIADRVESWVLGSTLRPRTLERYMYSLTALVRFGVNTRSGITRESIRDFLARRRDDGITAQTCNRDLAAVLSFCGWLESRGEFPITRILELRRLRLETPTPPQPRFLTRVEYERLAESATRFRIQLGLAVSIAVHAGLRLGELRTLRREDMELDGPSPCIHVRRTLGRETKTGVERTPPVAKAFAAELREAGWLPKTGPIFRHGGRGSRSPYLCIVTLERWLQKVRDEAGLSSDVTFIVMRHTYASWLVQAGVSIAKVAKWMGHGINVCHRHYAGLAPGGDPDVERGFVRPELN